MGNAHERFDRRGIKKGTTMPSSALPAAAVPDDIGG
jgi:hypothetical protein